MYLNNLVIAGRLTKDAEVKFLPSGTPVVELNIAVNRSYKTKEDEWKDETYFFDVKTIGKIPESKLSRLVKGEMVIVEGELRQDRWAGENGKKVKNWIYAKRISFPERKEKNQQIETEEDIDW